MGSWRKLLRRMANDPKPRGYTYDEAARVLSNLGFEKPSKPGGSHRVWRLKLAIGNVIRVQLVEKGHGTLKPEYIQDMVATLRTYGLLPEDGDDAAEPEPRV